MLAAFLVSLTVYLVRSKTAAISAPRPRPAIATASASSPRRFDVGPRCFIPSAAPSAILVSLPASPLAAGLTQVLTALDVPCTAIAAPSTEALADATLWVCDDLAFAAAAAVPRSLRVVVFSADFAPSLPNVEVLHPTAPTARLLDLAAAWSNMEAATLSTREREILSLVSRGLSNEDIAAACFVSTATVKTHLLRSFRKLGVSDRAAAVYKAVKMGLIV